MQVQQKQIFITGKEGEAFDADLSASWTKNYRRKHPGETVSHFFGREILQKILAQKDCMGIRFYYAFSKPLNGWQRAMVSVSKFLLNVIGNIEGENHLIMVGVLSDGQDQLPVKLSTSNKHSKTVPFANVISDDTGIIGQQSTPCPGSPGCPGSYDCPDNYLTS